MFRIRHLNKLNPTSLHGDVRSLNVEEDVKTTAVNHAVVEGESSPPVADAISICTGIAHVGGSGGISKSSMIIPVYVSHYDSPEREVLTYAMLDSQSDTTFILDQTYQDLGLQGSQTKLSLSTMSAKNQIINSNKVKGLMVRGYNTSLKIPLPAAFSRDMIPVNRTHIPTPEITKQWPHLSQVAAELSPLLDCHVGLLIGYNCSRALMRP